MTPEENLSPKNFLSVCDVAMDILEELQMFAKNVITIPLLRTVIRSGFNILMPGGDVNSGERYCNYRFKAIEYLKANNYIKDFEPSDDNFIFNRQVKITIDREVFNKLYDKLEKAYQKRVVEPAQKEQKQKEAEIRAKEIKNIAGSHPSKKWFSPNNLLVWIIGSIIIAVAAGLILNWLLK